MGWPTIERNVAIRAKRRVSSFRKIAIVSRAWPSFESGGAPVDAWPASTDAGTSPRPKGGANAARSWIQRIFWSSMTSRRCLTN